MNFKPSMLRHVNRDAMNPHAQSEVKEMTVEAVVIRADGTREDLGVVTYYHRNPLKRLWRRLTHKA